MFFIQDPERSPEGSRHLLYYFPQPPPGYQSSREVVAEYYSCPEAPLEAKVMAHVPVGEWGLEIFGGIRVPPLLTHSLQCNSTCSWCSWLWVSLC